MSGLLREMPGIKRDYDGSKKEDEFRKSIWRNIPYSSLFQETASPPLKHSYLLVYLSV
jgi:hypothetical protein